MTFKAFFKAYYLDELQRLQEERFYFYSFILMAQGIETLGALLDRKPFKAKGQSRQRFRLAINQLFDSRYQKVNAQDWLYQHYRCTMTHVAQPSGRLYLTHRGADDGLQHLAWKQEQLVLIAEDLLDDFLKAAEKAFAMIEKGTVKEKQFSAHAGPAVSTLFTGK